MKWLYWLAEREERKKQLKLRRAHFTARALNRANRRRLAEGYAASPRDLQFLIGIAKDSDLEELEAAGLVRLQKRKPAKGHSYYWATPLEDCWPVARQCLQIELEERELPR